MDFLSLARINPWLALGDAIVQLAAGITVSAGKATGNQTAVSVGKSISSVESGIFKHKDMLV